MLIFRNEEQMKKSISLTLLSDLFQNIHNGSHLCLDLSHLAVDFFLDFLLDICRIGFNFAVDLGYLVSHFSLDFFGGTGNIGIRCSDLLLGEDLHSRHDAYPFICLFSFIIHLERKHNFVIVDQRFSPRIPIPPDGIHEHKRFFV